MDTMTLQEYDAALYKGDITIKLAYNLALNLSKKYKRPSFVVIPSWRECLSISLDAEFLDFVSYEDYTCMEHETPPCVGIIEYSDLCRWYRVFYAKDMEHLRDPEKKQFWGDRFPCSFASIIYYRLDKYCNKDTEYPISILKTHTRYGLVDTDADIDHSNQSMSAILSHPYIQRPIPILSTLL